MGNSGSTVFQLNGVNVAPGQLYKGRLQLTKLSDGHWLEAPLLVAHGKKPGPIVVIGAGIHGDEINGIQTAIKSVRAIDLAELRGTVVALPVQNPIGFRHRRRRLVFNEQDRKSNVHQAFPGDPDGETSERIVYKIRNDIILAAGADLVFDMHTGTSTFFCAPHTFVASASFGDVADKALAAAGAFDTGLVVQAGSGVYAAHDMPHTDLAAEGVPVLGVELGAGGRYEQDMVEQGVQGVLNVLRMMDMLPGSLDSRPQVLLDDVVWVRAATGGLFRPKVKLGDQVRAGDVLGDVIDLFGEPVDQFTAPVGGHLISFTGVPTLHEGEPVARIGVPAV